MAEGTQPGAFIPHDTAVNPIARKKSTSGLNDLLLLCGIVLLVASIALAVAVFLYQQFLTTEGSSKLQQLQRAEAEFDPSLIQQLTRLDDRMQAGNAILSQHIAPTAFFAALQASTLQSVSFQSLDFEAPDPQHITLKMSGVAQSVNSIALQSDLFSQNGVIQSPIFSGITRESDGVHFNLTAAVNPTAIGFESLVQQANQQDQSQSAPVQQPSAPGPASPFGSGTSTTGTSTQ